MSSRDYWFEPKRYGYGAGLPTCWQGWALIIGYVLLLVGTGFLMRYTMTGYLSVVAMLTAAMFVIAARKTRGGWRWRWGERD